MAISTDFVDKEAAPKASQMSQDERFGDSEEEAQEIYGSQVLCFPMQNYQGSLKEFGNESYVNYNCFSQYFLKIARL